MDYLQNVVVEYLRADRAVFVNAECCIQLNESENPDASGPHWYCDAVAVDFRQSTVFLCEVSYADSLEAMFKRLEAWNRYWPGVRRAIARDCHVPELWPVRPWLFVPERSVDLLLRRMGNLGSAAGEQRTVPDPLVTTLELTMPWTYRSWNRAGEAEKPSSIPVPMRK